MFIYIACHISPIICHAFMYHVSYLMCIYVYVSRYMLKHMCVYIYMYIMCVCVYIHVYTYMYTYAYIHVHTNAYTYMRIGIHTQTHLRVHR